MKHSMTYQGSLGEMCSSLRQYRRLIYQMAKREVVSRYRGSIMGIAWSFFNPVLMLIIYTFVFSTVFKARWGVEGEESKAVFAIVLFVGMIVHGLFAECVNRAPQLIISNTNYVKKSSFLWKFYLGSQCVQPYSRLVLACWCCWWCNWPYPHGYHGPLFFCRLSLPRWGFPGG